VKKRLVDLAKLNGTEEDILGDLVTKKIRVRYSLSKELAVNRKREVRPDEFEEMNTYIESCIAEAKKELGL
jgi:hypothetical protein